MRMTAILPRRAGRRSLERWARILASERHSFLVAFLLVLAFDLYWYGAFLSFPLFGEDAGALYSSLIETVNDGHLATLGFPLKWLEGLGQPNLFVSFTFDPFAWTLLLPLKPADAFRLSMALRASVGWLASYWFVLLLFRGRRAIALLAATLYLLTDFTLMNAWGIHTFAGMYNATHAALFPLLAALALLVMRGGLRLGWPDLALFATLLFFLLDYPIGSLMGLAVLLVYAAVTLVFARPAERSAAGWGLAKIAAMAAILLLAPPFQALSSWLAVVHDSARTVFSNELFAYGYDYVPPVMWRWTSPALRVCVLVSLAALLFNRRWPRALRIAVAVLVLVVGGVQLTALVKYLGWLPSLVDRLPRFQFFEFYTTPCYAASGGFALYYWRDLLFPSFAGGRRLLSWLRGAVLFFPLAAVVLPAGAVAVGVYALLAALAGARGEAAEAGWMASPLWRRLAARAGLAALVLLAIGAWLPPTGEIYPIFYLHGRCRDGVLWCKDAAGATMGMGANPLTRYLRQALDQRGSFAGRAETLVRPPVRFERVSAGPIKWTPELYDRLHGWYERAYDALVVKYSPRDNPDWLPPDEMTWLARGPLLEALDKLGHNDVPFLGPSQEDLVLEMHKWYEDEGRPYGLVARDLIDPWAGMLSVTAVVDERNAAYFATGNGLMMRALPFQGVAVASSYEQSLGYLYYLMWTRYVSAGEPAKKSINMTSLEALHPERLALLGVRYLVARDSKVYEPPPLKRVMSWHGYSVYEVPRANLAGYAVRKLVFGSTLTDELRLMRQHGFHPVDAAALPERARESFVRSGGAPLAALKRASLELKPDSLTFAAASAGGESVVVLPVNWSNCWRAEWRKGAGRLGRADVDLTAVAFSGEIELSLTWQAGYGGATSCLRADDALVAEAKRAAAEVGFAEAYEPIGKETPPFAANRPRFAKDIVEATVLERRPMYESGDEVVAPTSLRAALSPEEMQGTAWTTAAAIDFRPSGDGYRLELSNDGDASLVVLPLKYSPCWRPRWLSGTGTLVPADVTRLAVLFRKEASLELDPPSGAAAAECAVEDAARERIADLLRRDGGNIVGAGYKLGDTIVFKAGGGSEDYTTKGWAEPEPWGRWSLGNEARLVLRLSHPPAGDLELDAAVGALILPNRPEVSARVSVNGAPLGTWHFDAGNNSAPRVLTVPHDVVAGVRVLVIDFKLDHVVSPLALGASSDPRPLALSFRTLVVRPAGAG